MNTTVSRAVAMALHDAGAGVGTFVPGQGGSEIWAEYCSVTGTQPPVSFHEEVAYTLAHGAALTGCRAFSILKTHGVMKAANSVSDSLYTGTTAGLVLLVADDRTGIQSDSIVDTKVFLEGLEIPHSFTGVEEVYSEVLERFALSEHLQLPVALVVDASETSFPCSVMPVAPGFGPLASSPPVYKRDITRHLLCPPFCQYQKQVFRQRLKGKDSENIPRPVIGQLPESLPPQWQWMMEEYSTLFQVFGEFRGELVAGDTGMSSLFSFPPFDAIDITSYMGGSVALALGAHLGGKRPAWAVTGDFSFLAAGHLGLVEAVHRNIPLKVLIIKNGKAETTGGHPAPSDLLERVLRPYQEYVRHIPDPGDRENVRKILWEAEHSLEMRVVVSDHTRPRN
jgi:TPP-dependent indolepyruvate ferredoxin oxidoreductase alpha subunit